MKTRLWVAVAACFVLAVACDLDAPNDRCAVDGDCNTGRVCVDLHCRDRSAAQGPSGDGGDGSAPPPSCACPSNERCVDGGCALGGTLVLFGGDNPQLSDLAMPGETWTWDGVAWKKALDQGPQNRWGAAIASLGGRTFLLGGDTACCASRSPETWELAAGTWKKAPDLVRPTWFFASGALDGEIYVFGGGDVVSGGEFASFDGARWRTVPGATPQWRRDVAGAVLGSRLLLVGGLTTSNIGVLSEITADTLEWDGTNFATLSAGGASARYGAAAATLGDRVVMFGGATSLKAEAASLSGETWEWDGTRWMLRDTGVSAPSARTHAAMATLNGRVVLFGGMTYDANGPRYLADTWEWDGARWRERAVVGPSGRRGAAMGPLP